MQDYNMTTAAAMRVLIWDGDYNKRQAAIILGHALKQERGGKTYYSASYIRQRAAR